MTEPCPGTAGSDPSPKAGLEERKPSVPEGWAPERGEVALPLSTRLSEGSGETHVAVTEVEEREGHEVLTSVTLWEQVSRSEQALALGF